MLSFSILFGFANADPLNANYVNDPAATRGLILPTAQTLEKGQLTLSSIELVLFNVNYGINDKLSAQFTSLLPIFPVGFGGQLSVRYKFLDSDKINLAVEPSALIGAGDSGLSTIFGGGIIGDYSVGDSGRFIITGSLSTQTLAGFDSTGSDLGISDGALGIAGLGAQLTLASNFKLMGELMVPIGFFDGTVDVAEEVTFLNLGFRRIGDFTWDFSIIRPWSVDQGWFILPYIAVTRRFDLNPKVSQK
ncbi:MAG: hypothetical protein CL916_01380 [Deltaproteobacteria bacterium]|nr:hypothetical protein [Deltaproteobacteria bacterium]